MGDAHFYGISDFQDIYPHEFIGRCLPIAIGTMGFISFGEFPYYVSAQIQKALPYAMGFITFKGFKPLPVKRFLREMGSHVTGHNPYLYLLYY